MQCAKMQGSTKAATVLDPSPSHFANALQISGSASPAQILLISGEAGINESRQEERHKKSSWIRRLKPVDVPELSKGGGSTEASLGTTYSEKGNSFERMDVVGSGNVQTGWSLQGKAANRVRVRQGESVSDAKRQKVSEQRDSDVVEKPRSESYQEKTAMVEPAKSTISSPITLQSNAGFGPWVNFSKKSDTKLESSVGSKGVAGTATTCTQEVSKDNQRNFCSAFTMTNSKPRCSSASMVGDVTSPVTFVKSPLSPVHSKIGLPPRPPSQKSPGFHAPAKVAPAPSASGMGRWGSHQFVQDTQPSRQAFEKPSNGESKQFVSVQDKDAKALTVAEVARCESFTQNPHSAEQSFIDSTRDRAKGSSDRGQQLLAAVSMGNSNLPSRQAGPSMAKRASTHISIGQPLSSCSNGAAIDYNRRGVFEDVQMNLPGEAVRGTICTNLPSEGMDLHLTVSAPGLESPRSVVKNGCTNMEPKKTSFSGSSHEKILTCEKADASGSTSATLPWEMFIESAGTSRVAREQFVEVYNRARDELKNQRMSQRTSSAWSKETDSGLKLTSGPGDTVSEHTLRRQFSKHEQHLVGLSQTLGRLSTNPVHRALSAASNPKEKHLTGPVESKASDRNLANDQSGLIRDNCVSPKSDTLWKQADDFRIEQNLPKGQPSVSVRTVVQEGDQQDKGQNFSSPSAATTRGLASKPCEGNGLTQIAQLSPQLDDRKGLASAVCNRPLVSSEEPSISRATDKGMGGQVKPPSRPHVWLQRWHPTGVYNFKGLPDTLVSPSDGKRSDSGSPLAHNVKKFKDGDGVGVFGRSRESKNVVTDKETGVKMLKTSPSKTVPSAAAMAIVGTAARQFCSTQPQRKGAFAFWSGFGMPPPRKVESVQQEKGKAKMFSKVDEDTPTC